MIVRATSDLHLTQRSAEWVFAALGELRADADKHGGHTVLVGDVFDQSTTIHMPTWNRLRDLLIDWPGQVFVVAGNHDQYSGYRNVLEGLGGQGDVSVISEPRRTPLGLMVPYTPPDKFWSTAEDASKNAPAIQDIGSSPPIWWTHQGWRGSYLNNMRRDRDGLSVKQAGKRLIISGHYHMPQNLGSVIYCGSPYETSFAEEGQIKGWLRWGDLSSAPEPTRVPFKKVGAPKHWTVRWDPALGDPERPKGWKKGDKIRVIAAASRDELKSIGAAKTLKAAGLEGASIVVEVAGKGRAVIDRNAAPQEAAMQYVDRVFGPEESRVHPVALHSWATEVDLWGS